MPELINRMARCSMVQARSSTIERMLRSAPRITPAISGRIGKRCGNQRRGGLGSFLHRAQADERRRREQRSIAVENHDKPVLFADRFLTRGNGMSGASWFPLARVLHAARA